MNAGISARNKSLLSYVLLLLKPPVSLFGFSLGFSTKKKDKVLQLLLMFSGNIIISQYPVQQML